MKSLKGQLIAAIAMTLISVVTISSSTYAWFSTNNSVEASGMKVTATTTGSLVITTDVPSSSSSASSVSFGNTAVSLKPVQHSTEGDSSSNPYNLRYVSNAGLIDVDTGLKRDGETGDLEYAYVSSTDKDQYFKDYVCFISSAGQALDTQDLKVTIDTTKPSDGLSQAISIDFYALTEGSNTNEFTGTSNFIVTKSLYADTTDEKKTFTVLSNISIPVRDAQKGVKICMRVYYDGALTDNGKALVNTNTFTETEQTLAVTFSAVKHTN